jgi:hypothetical protein
MTGNPPSPPQTAKGKSLYIKKHLVRQGLFLCTAIIILPIIPKVFSLKKARRTDRRISPTSYRSPQTPVYSAPTLF